MFVVLVEALGADCFVAGGAISGPHGGCQVAAGDIIRKNLAKENVMLEPFIPACEVLL